MVADRAWAPTNYDVAVVAAMMLWPANDAMRRRMLDVATIEFALLSGNHPQPETASERKEFFELIRTTPTLSHYSKDIEEAYRFGMIAGALLRGVIAGTENGHPVTLGDMKTRLASKFAAERISVSTINNRIWKDYRCVAAYWAAHIELSSPDDAGSLPCCCPADLPRFLAAADELRRRGEAVRVPQSPEALLRKGETIAVF